MEKFDLLKQYRSYYTAKARPEIIEVEKARFLSITGKGDPSGSHFSEHISALYSTAYAIKFHCKQQGNDFTVTKLEGLWWFDEQRFSGLSMKETSQQVPRSEWEYRLLIRVPPFVTEANVWQGIETSYSRNRLEEIKRIELFHMNEGKSVQMLHVGPFSSEPETLAQMQQFIEEQGLSRNGLHHEIYLSDFRKTAPARLRTILREPVKQP